MLDLSLRTVSGEVLTMKPSGEGLTMKPAKHYEFQVVAPSKPLIISLHLQPEEVELAIATEGTSLSEKTMRAIVEALIACDDLPSEPTR